MTATRVTLPLPPGCTAERNTAAGRKGATRWSVWYGPVPPPPQLDDTGYLGDLVRWMPEGTWSWQPAGTYAAIVAGAPRPEEVEQGTLAECGAALARAAQARREPDPLTAQDWLNLADLAEQALQHDGFIDGRVEAEARPLLEALHAKVAALAAWHYDQEAGDPR